MQGAVCGRCFCESRRAEAQRECDRGVRERPAHGDEGIDVVRAASRGTVRGEYERAKARGAEIYAELVGYGATSDGHDMVAPSGEGAIRCMHQALAGFDGRAVAASEVQYINAHGTSTPVGDVAELGAVKAVFGEGTTPAVGSTKSLTGHALGAAGSNESIYSLLMMDGGFLAQSPNIVELDEATAGVDILTEARAPKVWWLKCWARRWRRV